MKRSTGAMAWAAVRGFLVTRPIWGVFVAIFVLACVVVPSFASLGTFLDVLLHTSVNGVMAVGMTFLMINGFFDLSVGTTMGFAAALTIGLQPYGMAVAILAAMAAGIAVGAINGFFVTRAKINAFVVTLGSFIGMHGVLFIYTQQKSILGQNNAFGSFGLSDLFGFPVLALIMLAIIALGEFVLRKTRHGRSTYAVGGNMDAARNAGISVNRVILINFMICGFTAGIAGILQSSEMNAAMPTLGYPDTNLIIIATVALGGTKLRGGYGSMISTLGGVLVLGIVQDGMDLLGVPAFLYRLLFGVILILVVLADAKVRPGTARARTSAKYVHS